MKQLLMYCGIIIMLSSCLKDTCVNSFTIYHPVFKSLSAVRADMKTTAAIPLERTGKIYLYKNYIFLNEKGRGIHIIDNANPAAPINKGFIPIPGNIDIAIKDNYLYADSYSDLVVLNISDMQHITPEKFLDNVFPGRGNFYSSTNPDSAQVLVSYIAKDTVMRCSTYDSLVSGCAGCLNNNGDAFYLASSSTGTGGSMAAFTILNNYLYTLYYSNLHGFDINNAADPQLKNTITLNQVAETIYPFQQTLFIGTPSGMFMYDVANPATPRALGAFSHITSCDPVIADENNAYVTLRSGTNCMSFTNQLDVLDIKDLMHPLPVATYPMTNPHGLSKDGQWLFICDGSDGMKIYDATNPSVVTLKNHLKGFETYDVIAHNRLAIVVGTDGIYQFDYSDIANIKELSKITTQHKN